MIEKIDPSMKLFFCPSCLKRFYSSKYILIKGWDTKKDIPHRQYRVECPFCYTPAYRDEE